MVYGTVCIIWDAKLAYGILIGVAGVPSMGAVGYIFYCVAQLAWKLQKERLAKLLIGHGIGREPGVDDTLNTIVNLAAPYKCESDSHARLFSRRDTSYIYIFGSLREADLLCDAGHDVRVVAPSFIPELAKMTSFS